MKQGRFISAIFLAVTITACEYPYPIPGTGSSDSNVNPTPPPAPPAPPPTTDAPPSVTLLGAQLGIRDQVNLKAFDGPVQDQFGGTCTAFATAAAMNNLLKQKGIQKTVSERHLWSTYGVYDADYAAEAANENFITESKYWPTYGNKKSNYLDYASLRLSDFKSLDYNHLDALKALNRNHPLIMAVQTPSDLGSCEEYVSPNSYATDGQHVIEAVGYQLDDKVPGGGYFLIKNSWGTDCGDQGYHRFPFSLCKRSDLYCYFIEAIDVEDRS